MTKAFPFYDQDGLHVAIYDQFAAQQGYDDVPFYLELAGETGGPVLEVGCGTGRVVWPLAAAGFEVVGLDLSPPMLRRALAKRSLHPDADATFVEGNMADFDLGQEFGLIFLAFRSFQMLHTPEDQRRALACFRRHLAPGGLLVIDVFDPMLEFLVPGAVIENTGTFVHPDRGTRVTFEATDRTLDHVRQVFTETWVFREFDADGNEVRTEAEELTMRWGFRYEMHHLFELAGFQVEAEYSDYDRSPPAYAHEQIWLLREPS